MPSNHLILCHSLLLLPSIFSRIRIFSNELLLHIRWPKYWSFSSSISPSSEYSGLISFRMDWLDLLAVQGVLKSLLQHHSSKASALQCSAFFSVQLSHPYMISGKTIALTRFLMDLCRQRTLLFNMLSRFCHTSTWIRHRCTRIPNPKLPSHLPCNTIPPGHPSAPAPSILHPASNLDWQFVSYMILYMFQCHYPKSSHPCPLPQSPKDCSIHLCLFCCLSYRVIITIFLISIYMC